MLALRILLVDDDAITRHTLTRLLRDAGFEVHASATCTQALKTMAEVPIDLLSLTWNFPSFSRQRVDAADRQAVFHTRNCIVRVRKTRVAGCGVCRSSGQTDRIRSPVTAIEPPPRSCSMDIAVIERRFPVLNCPAGPTLMGRLIW